MKDGHLDTAACHYNKEVQYCSVASMNYCEGEDKVHHLKDCLCACTPKSGGGGKRPNSVTVLWSPLVCLVITSWINLALLLLKLRVTGVSDAISQALKALQSFVPFMSPQQTLTITRTATARKKKEGDNHKEGRDAIVFDN
jgi:hypothetical protein